ncbi:TonB-dependent receptor, partial [Bacillus pumilus]|uniref:TonB-dependent receptor domain-containing protein n=1 Tax=Bacillus pumilus TaxID=1408 RepID=UPI003314C694
KQLTTGIEFSRNYTQLFPTAYFQYAANEQNNFVFNYGRRIRRPDYQSLNPFVMFLDRYTFEQGNPNLSPQFSHNIEVTHSFKGMINTTLNYTRTNNIIQAVIEQNELANETFVKQANIAKQQQYGIAVSGGTQIASWYALNFFGNLFNNKFEGLI